MNEDLNPLNVPEPNAIDQESRVQDILHKVGEESYGTPLQMTEALIPQETRKAPPMTLTDAVHMWDTVLGANINAAPNIPVDVIKTAATPPAGNLAMMLPPPAPLDNNGNPIIGSAPDIWDEALGNIREGQRRAIRASMGLVADKNPDEVAKQQQEAASLGASFDIYTRNRAAFQKQYRMDDVVNQDLPTSAPVLADYMTNPNFAAIAQDDVSHLSAWEKTAKYISDMFVDSSQVVLPNNPDAIFSPEFWMFDPQAPEVLKSVGENLTAVKGFQHGYGTRAMWEYSATQVAGKPALMESLAGVETKSDSTKRIIAWNKELNEGPPTAMAVIQHVKADYLFDYVKQARDTAYANAIDRGASEQEAKVIADQAAAGAMRPTPTSLSPHGPIGIIADMIGMEAHKLQQRAKTVGGAFIAGELVGVGFGGAPALATGPVAARIAWRATAAEQAFRDAVGMIYSRAIMEGVPEDDAASVALTYAGPLAIVNYGLERLTMPGFTSEAAKKEIAAATARRIEQAVAKPSVMAATRRVAGEYTGTLLKGSAFATLQVVGLELANDQARAASGMVPLIATPEGREQFGKNVADNLEYMLIGIAGMSVLSPTEHNPIMRAAQEAAAISRGKEVHAQLDTILRLSRESALRRRSPDAAASFQNDAAAAAEFPHIYINKQGLLDALGRLNIPIERLDQILPGASEQLKDQSNGEAGINGYVKINSGDFFSKVGETDLGRALRQHITADPDVPTYSEAVAAERFRSKFNDSPEEMVREVNDRVVKNEEHERQLDAIQQKFEQDALAAGRSPEESQVIGVFGRSMLRGLANALKLSPEEAHRKFGYRVVGEPTAARTAETPATRVEAEPMSESDVHPLSRAVGGLAARVSEHNARVANEGRDASHPEAKAGRALNDSVRKLQAAIDAKDEVDIASQSWRLRNRLKASREHLNANTVKAIETMLAKTDAFMQQRGLEISDPIGQEFVDGGNEHNVIAWMPPANGEPGTGTGGTITEVTEPGVVRVAGNQREVLQRGEVVATMHTAEQAAQAEANLAQREAALRARLTGTQAAERGAGAAETLHQEELRGASEPRLFQRPLEQPAFGPSEGVQGSFNLRTLEIMLTKRATWRTAAHEFIHAYWNGFLSISSMENAPPHVLRDIDTVLRWMGIEGATPEERRVKYMSMSLEERRPHEEALAYSGEVYFSEGKAPNEELRGVFERLSQWMLKLYGDIRGKLNDDYRARYGRDLPILTGEVRQVFDRWMAAEDTITHTETMREMKGVWQTREESPLNDAEWAEYQEKQQSAHDASVADLNTRSIQVQERIGRLEESTKRGIVAKAKKIRAAVREEIADAVSAEPLYRAMQFLKRGLIRNDKGEDVKSDTVVKLNRDVVVSMIGEDAAAALGGGKYGMLSKDGVHPDVVAEMFGFESGKAFVERLWVAPTFEKAVEFRTDQRMIREHSDLTDPKKIQRAVDEAVHNVARREFVALEFKLLARATEPVKIMAEAARSVAMDRINGMRIRDINQRQHILAESKAARTALDAVQATPPKIDMERIVKKARTAAVAQSLKDGKTEVEAALAGELAAVDARAKAQRRLDAFREKYGDKDPHEVAIRAKRQQLLQSHLATAALDALNEVDAAMDGIKKIFGSDEKIGKTRDFNMVLAARSILAHFGLGTSDKTPAEYTKNIEQFNPSLYADLKPILDRLSAGPQDYRELTMVEFRGVMDAVNALWENARRDKVMMIDGKRVAVAEAMEEFRARMEEIGPERKPVSGAASNFDWFMRNANEFKTVWRRVEHWCAAMDGPNGPGFFTKYLWRPIVGGMDAYRADYAKYVERYGDDVHALNLPAGKINAYELTDGRFEKPGAKVPGYTFGSANGGIGLLELLGAMAHAGNESNLRKMLLGYGWGHLDADGNLVTTKWDTFVNRMIKEGVLTKKHFDFLQAMWDRNEELGNLAQRAKYDMDGCYYDKIEPRAFETPWGVYKGGYVPAAVDEYLVSEIETIRNLKQIDADFRQEMPSVGFGFTKSRSEGFNEYLALDLRIIGKHIDSVLRYVHVAPRIKDVMRILNNREFRSQVDQLDPNAINKLIIPMLERAARNSITKPGLDPSVDRFWSTIRRRTSLNFMAANLRQIGHAGGFTAAYVKVDAGQLHSALAQYTMNPSQVATDIAKMSPMMDERLHNQVMDARDRLMDILEDRGPMGKTEAWFRNHGMFLSHALHNQMDIIIWLGKFNETMEKLGPEVGMDEAKQEAIHRADAAVRMTQGSAHAEDVARYQTGTPFAQAMFSFTGYLNTIANLNADEFVMSMRDMGIAKGAGRLVYSHIMAYAIPMLVFEGFAKTVSGDWNKKKHDSLLHDVLEFIFASYAHGAVGMIPGGSQIYSGITATAHAVQRVQGGPVPFHGDHIEVAPTIAALENATVGTAEAIARLTSKNKKVTGHNVRDVMTLMSLLTGVPTAPVAKPIGYMMDVNQKKIKPTSTYDYVRGAVSGVGSPASKNK